MFRPSVCRIVIGKDRTFCRFPRKNPYGARRNGLSSTAGPRVRISFPPAQKSRANLSLGERSQESPDQRRQGRAEAGAQSALGSVLTAGHPENSWLRSR